MDSLTDRLLTTYLSAHCGVIARREVLELAITPTQLDWAVRSSRLVVVHRGVYARGGAPLGFQGSTMAACLALPGAVASHRSAAALWGLLEHPPAVPDVSVPGHQRPRVPGISAHRSGDLDRSRTVLRHGIPTTDPVRTLVDLGQVVRGRVLDDAIDQARSLRLVDIAALEAELSRLARQGRRGPAALRSALLRRGFVESPTPSVLESRVLRLLHAWGVDPLAAEVVVLGGRYRLDFLLRPGLALEVDGYAFHFSPEAKAADASRRNALALAGITVIQSDWVTVMRRDAGGSRPRREPVGVDTRARAAGWRLGLAGPRWLAPPARDPRSPTRAYDRRASADLGEPVDRPQNGQHRRTCATAAPRPTPAWPRRPRRASR